MGVENGNLFRSEIGSGFEDPGGTPPLRIPRSTPPPPPGTKLYAVLCNSLAIVFVFP